MNWTKIIVKSVKDVFDAVYSNLGTKESGKIIGINPKGDISYKIDKMAEEIYLNNLPKDVTIVSEESRPEIRGNAVVILDPICGSILAKRGSKHFATGIAVYSPELEPICEAIGNFETGDIYHASNRGAFKNSRKVHSANTKKIDDNAIINFESHLVQSRLGMVNKKIFRAAPHVFCPGSVKMSLGMIAEGVIDAYVCAGNVFPSTELIGKFLVEKSGGVSSDIKGRPLKIYPDLTHMTTMLCSCTKELHVSLLKML